MKIRVPPISTNRLEQAATSRRAAKKYISCLLGHTVYVAFWVIPRRPSFNSRRFGTPYRFNLHRQVPMKMEQIRSSETSAIKTQTPGNYPKRSILKYCLLSTTHFVSKQSNTFEGVPRKEGRGYERTCCGVCSALNRLTFRHRASSI